MSLLRTYTCEVCGAPKNPGDEGWYLAFENEWGDNLEILAWDDELAAQNGMMHLCGGGHLQRWVSHWMQPTRTEYPQATHLPSPDLSREIDPVRRTALQVGQIKVDRSALGAPAGDDPETLLTLLDALEDVLHEHGSELVPDPREDEVLVFDA